MGNPDAVDTILLERRGGVRRRIRRRGIRERGRLGEEEGE